MNDIPNELIANTLHFLAVPEYFFLTNYGLVSKTWHHVINQSFVALPRAETDDDTSSSTPPRSSKKRQREQLKRRSVLLPMPYFYLELKDIRDNQTASKTQQTVLDRMNRFLFGKVIWIVGNFRSSVPSRFMISHVLNMSFSTLGAKKLVVFGAYGFDTIHDMLDSLIPGYHSLEHVVYIGTHLKSTLYSTSFFPQKSTVESVMRKHMETTRFEGIWTKENNELVKDIGSCDHEVFTNLVTGHPVINFLELYHQIKSDVSLIKSIMPMYRTVSKCLAHELHDQSYSLLGSLFLFPHSNKIQNCIEYCLQECRQESQALDDYYSTFIETAKSTSWNSSLLEIVSSSLDLYRICELVTHMHRTYHSSFLAMMDSCNTSSIDLASIRDEITGDSVVHLAVRRRSEEFVNYLMNSPSFRSLNVVNNRGENALFDAARDGRYQFFSKLIQNQCDPFAKSMTNDSFLDVALNNYHVTFCRLAIRDLLLTSNDTSKLINLVSQQWWCDFLERTLVDSILNTTIDQLPLSLIPMITKFWKGNRTNWLRYYNGSTLVHLACARGLSNVLGVVLDSPLFVPDDETRFKVLFEDHDPTGASAFHLACQSHPQSSDKLKADLVDKIYSRYAVSPKVLTTPNSQGKTPIELAVDQGMISVAKVLSFHQNIASPTS